MKTSSLRSLNIDNERERERETETERENRRREGQRTEREGEIIEEKATYITKIELSSSKNASTREWNEMRQIPAICSSQSFVFVRSFISRLIDGFLCFCLCIT